MTVAGDHVSVAPRDADVAALEVDRVLHHAIRLGDRREALRLHRVDADAMVGEALRQRLTGFLIHAIERGALVGPDTLLDRVAAAHRRATWHALHLEQALLTAIDTFVAAGITTRVLKGPALVRTVYAESSVRTFADIDVLVPTAQFEQAVQLLMWAGHRRLLPQLRPGFDSRFTKTVTLVDDLGRQIDLHRSLVIGPFGLLIDLDDLFDGDQPIVVGGRTLRALAPTQQCLHVCYHAALGDVPPRLVPMRDVAEAFRRPTTDVDAVLAMAERWSGLGVVARAVRLASAHVGALPRHIVSWAHAYRPGRAERRRLASYTSVHRSNSRKYVESVRAIPGISDKAAYLYALLFPQRSFVERRPGDRWAWLRHGLSSYLHTEMIEPRSSGRRQP